MYLFIYLACVLLTFDLAASIDFINDTVIISLNNVMPSLTNSEVYNLKRTFRSSTSSTLKVRQIPVEINFLIIQAHSYENNITVSYDTNLNYSNHINGTNLGLYFNTKRTESIFRIFNFNQTATFDVYISIHAYIEKAPIPGGCNMEFNIENAPYLHIYESLNIIRLEAAAARMVNKANCDAASQTIKHDFYHMYISENNYSSAEYFQLLKKMMTVEGIMENGRKVSKVYGYGQMRRIFAMYPEVSTIYSVIATYGNYSSAYVPIHSRACVLSGSCDTPVLQIVFMALSSLVGLFICLFGQYFFKTQIFFFGFFSTSLVTLILMSVFVTYLIQVPSYVTLILCIVVIVIMSFCFFGNACGKMGSLGFMCTGILSLTFIYTFVDMPLPESFTISILAGVIGSLFWLILWNCLGIPITITLLASFCTGFHIATIVYFGMPDNHSLFHNDMNFWSSFFLVTFISQACILPLWHLGNILACAIIGSFMVVVPIDFVMGSYLRFIFINIVRRACVESFNNAVIDPPFQYRDGITTTIWIVLALLGILVQCNLMKYRAPFPPPSTLGVPSFSTSRARDLPTSFAAPSFLAAPTAPLPEYSETSSLLGHNPSTSARSAYYDRTLGDNNYEGNNTEVRPTLLERAHIYWLKKTGRFEEPYF